MFVVVLGEALGAEKTRFGGTENGRPPSFEGAVPCLARLPAKTRAPSNHTHPRNAVNLEPGPKHITIATPHNTGTGNCSRNISPSSGYGATSGHLRCFVYLILSQDTWHLCLNNREPALFKIFPFMFHVKHSGASSARALQRAPI